MSAHSNNTNQTFSAREVGWAFVRDYYKYFHENPEILHKFYDERSSLVRGLEGEEEKICQGLQEIKKNIAEMHLKDAKVDINNIDSLESSDNKVIVQVIGQFTNNGQTCKFVQTINLDTQQNGYYVLRDIFRYLKDEPKDINKSHPIDREPAYNEDITSTITEEKFNDDSVSTMSTGTNAEELTQEIISEIQSRTNVSQPSAKSTAEDTTSLVVEEAAPDNETKESVPIDKGTSITVQTEKNSTISNTATQLTSPTQAQSNLSYSNVAASDSSKWGQHIPEQKGRVVQQTLTRTHSQSSNRDQKGKELSLYIKGITPQMTQEKLAEAFESIGQVKSLDLVHAKSCAFVEFSSQEAYQKALSMKTIQIPGFANVIVEERHKNDNRPRHRSNYDNHYQRNFNPHNGMNTQRGGRGGDRRNTFPRPPAKSPS
ncbi:10555_t:CDS:2 [Acaulospora morrowiae]|uniref:10555_t:CDS:1 n=1 Tax=Acaulospora morrowiae TaxID=94023 RepID=A0A9N9A277_9GLOM|nr:10555_t:CDS:2 [Acaulospora morrowiae]